MSQGSSSFDHEAFAPIDWDAPLDPATYIDGVPEDHQIRGMFPDKVARLAAEQGRSLGRSRYIAFKFYPLREHMELMAEAVPLLYPDCSLREGLRRLGAHAAPTLLDSMIGRVFTSFVGGPKGAMSLVGKSYQTTRSGGSAKVVGYEDKRFVVVSLRDVWDYPDSLHIGIIETFIQQLELDWTPTLQGADVSSCLVKFSAPAG